MNLPPLVQTFVLHFGEMGSRWGVNRTVGQIYALLFVAPQPLNADDIVEALGVSRSNVSMGLKELQAWNLVRLQHKPNDRRDYYSAPEDIWQIVRTLVEERKKREIDPTLSMLREALMETPESAYRAPCAGRCGPCTSSGPLSAGTTACAASRQTRPRPACCPLGSRRSVRVAAGRPLPLPGAPRQKNTGARRAQARHSRPTTPDRRRIPRDAVSRCPRSKP